MRASIRRGGGRGKKTRLLGAFLLLGSPLFPPAAPAGPEERPAGEEGSPVVTEADRRLAAIVEAEGVLMDSYRRGELSEASLLARAQGIADRYESFLRDNPEHLYGWILAGKFLRTIGADQRAYEAFRRANDLDPEVAVVQQQLADILVGEGRHEPALGLFLRAVQLAPEEPVYQEDLGTFLLRFGPELEADGAVEAGRAPILASRAFRRAYELDPDNFDRAYRWAQSLEERTDPDWPAIAAAWEGLIPLPETRAGREAVRLQVARAWLRAGETGRAREWLAPVRTEPLRATWEGLREEAGFPLDAGTEGERGGSAEATGGTEGSRSGQP